MKQADFSAGAVEVVADRSGHRVLRRAAGRERNDRIRDAVVDAVVDASDGARIVDDAVGLAALKRDQP